MFGLSQPSGNHLTVSKSGPAAHAAAVRVRLITRLAMQLRARRRVEITVFSFHSRTYGLRSYRRSALAGRVSAPAIADGACPFEYEWTLVAGLSDSRRGRATERLSAAGGVHMRDGCAQPSPGVDVRRPWRGCRAPSRTTSVDVPSFDRGTTAYRADRHTCGRFGSPSRTAGRRSCRRSGRGDRPRTSSGARGAWYRRPQAARPGAAAHRARAPH